jgi:TolB-like protein
VAVNDFAVNDVDERVAQVVAESLVFELRKLERTSVISFEEVRQMMNLEAEKQAMGCSGDESCLAQIADALGVDYLVTGTLARVGDTHVFGLRLIDQAAASAERTVNKVLPAGNGVEFLGEVGPAVETLLPDVPRRPGQTRGISPEQVRRLVPPPLSPWVFAGTATAGGALLLGSGVAALFQASYQGDYRAIAARAKDNVESGAALVSAGRNAVVAEYAAWGLLGAGVLVTGLAAAMIPLTDFEGLGEDR